MEVQPLDTLLMKRVLSACPFAFLCLFAFVSYSCPLSSAKEDKICNPYTREKRKLLAADAPPTGLGLV
jgi:hypothetical protein